MLYSIILFFFVLLFVCLGPFSFFRTTTAKNKKPYIYVEPSKKLPFLNCYPSLCINIEIHFNVDNMLWRNHAMPCHAMPTANIIQPKKSMVFLIIILAEQFCEFGRKCIIKINKIKRKK